MNDQPRLYDLFHPAPAALKKICATKVAIKLWRQEIIKRRANGTLDKLVFDRNIQTNIMEFPPPFEDLPTVLLVIPTIDKHINIFRLSIKNWLSYHITNGFLPTKVLHKFDDFVGDFDGDIDYRRTAQQMILCDGISRVDKFKFACLYCLENDIVKIWPSISSRIDLNEINFYKFPQLFYWICRLRNQLYKIPIPGDLVKFVNAALLFRIISSKHAHWSCLEYFFDRVASVKRMPCVKYIFASFPQLFYRYVLAKLDKEELEEFQKSNRTEMWWYIYQTISWRSHYATAVWTYVKPLTTESYFIHLFQQMIVHQTDIHYLACFEIWKLIPDDFKQSTIKNVLLKDSLFREDGRNNPEPAKKFSFILAAMSEASYEERGVFWDKHWCDLMPALGTSDFRNLMTLCFKNENDSLLYRETVMANYEKIGKFCVKLFMGAHIDKLNEFIKLVCPGEQRVRDVRLRLLGENFSINLKHLKKPDELDQLINDAFNDTDRAIEYKNQLLSKPMNMINFESFVTNGYFCLIRNFIDKVIPSKRVVMDFKKAILPIYKQYLLDGNFLKTTNQEYIHFLRWLVASDDEVVAFKQALSVDEVVQEVIRLEMLRLSDGKRESSGRGVLTYCFELVKFLRWYFVTPEAYKAFLPKYAEDDVFVKLTAEFEEMEIN